MEERLSKEVKLEQGKRLIGLKTTSYNEYLAARHLMNDNFLQQSVILMNTCIEKEIKAYFFALEIPISANHETFKLYNVLCQHSSRFLQKINPEFIKAISKIYKSRYYENLGAGYNYVILKNKFLAEFDYTFSVLEPLTQIGSIDKKKERESRFEFDKRTENNILYRNNYLLTNISKNDFLSQPENVYEFRILKNHSSFELFYQTPKNIEDNKFIYEGLIPKDEKSFTTSHIVQGAPYK